MAKALVVVESPAKAKTINKYLGRDYKVVASMGHVRDLPKSKLGVDIENDFTEDYETLASRKKVIKELKDAAKDATDIYIATDPDREGEAIGWHLSEELGRQEAEFHRLTFNEITKKAIEDAFKHPRDIDTKMVAAQRARRVLDRLVGYKISPLLWDKVRRGLSAGRVQSVALKLVCDREREIEAFVPEEYWNIFARLAGRSARVRRQAAEEERRDDQGRQRGHSRSGAGRSRRRDVDCLVGHDQGAEAARATAVHHQQAAADRALPGQEDDDARAAAVRRASSCRLGRRRPIGLITYMRTDSVRVSDEALDGGPRARGNRVRRRLSA